jgi:pterin-4a-carbinolamine dehydratase
MSSNEEIQRAIAELANGWELKEGKIVKYFQFPSFMKAMDFVNRLLTRLTTIRLLRLTGEPSNCP